MLYWETKKKWEEISLATLIQSNSNKISLEDNPMTLLGMLSWRIQNNHHTKKLCMGNIMLTKLELLISKEFHAVLEVLFQIQIPCLYRKSARRNSLATCRQCWEKTSHTQETLGTYEHFPRINKWFTLKFKSFLIVAK